MEKQEWQEAEAERARWRRDPIGSQSRTRGRTFCAVCCVSATLILLVVYARTKKPASDDDNTHHMSSMLKYIPESMLARVGLASGAGFSHRDPHDLQGWPWSGRDPVFAYSTYATTEQYLCNALVLFESLRSLKVDARLALVYPEDWDAIPDNTTAIARMLDAARHSYGADLFPEPLLHSAFLEGTDRTWTESNNKLWQLSLPYDRILAFDSDGLILRSMDHLFWSPPADLGMPRAYWADEGTFLSSQWLLAMPSAQLWSKAKALIDQPREDTRYDMEISNMLAARNGIVLPHYKTLLLSGVFRWPTHEKYLPITQTYFNATEELNTAYYVHFSDWPMPKPWRPDDGKAEELQPPCAKIQGEFEDCSARQAWRRLYTLFHDKAERVCQPLRT